MENPQLETLNPSEKPPSNFPPYRRRRPLKSHTFDTFIRIVSLCHSELPKKPEKDAVVQCDQVVGNNEPRSEDAIRNEKSVVDEDREVVGSQGPGCSSEPMDTDGLAGRGDVNCGPDELMNRNGEESMDNVTGNGDQGFVDNIGLMNSVVEGSQYNGNENQEDQFSLPDLDMGDFEFPEDFGEKGPSFDVAELIESLVETDVTVGHSEPIVNKGEKSSAVDRDETEKGRESDTSFSASVMVSKIPQITDTDVEDGEISTDSGIFEKSSDLSHEDVSFEKKSEKEGKVSEDPLQRDGFSQIELPIGHEKDNQANGLSLDRVDKIGSSMDVKMKDNNRNLVDSRSNLVYYGDILDDDSAAGKGGRLECGRIKQQRYGPKEASSPASCTKNLTPNGGSKGEEIVTVNQCDASKEKDANLNNKKRKRGPGSLERKAKKKKKERMKRAEKNRELGIKRLKLPPPVLKPKPVTFCRHFINGRCQEGEKCKFSHDTIPLTKSKPCCHFARQSCMKGDDCPYDHQLSKYPCNNYLTQGSCNRRANCMFSHEVPAKESSGPASDVLKPAVQSVSTKPNSNLMKQMNPSGTSNQNVSPKLWSSGVSSSTIVKQNEGGTIPKSAGQAPKGISFLSHGKLSVGNTSRHAQPALSPKTDKGARVDQQTITHASDVAQSSNENTKTTPIVTPRGVNFLSFGKPPSNDSSSKKSSSFSFISNLQNGKSPLSDSSKNEQAGSSLKTENNVKVVSQTSQGTSTISQNLNEAANRTPASTPRSLNLLSVGNQFDSSVNKKQTGSHLNEINTVQQQTIANTNIVTDKVQIPNQVSPQIPSSLLHENRLSDKFKYVQSKFSLTSSPGSLLSSTPSSMQKALQSTLAFAAKFDSEANNIRSHGATTGSMEASSSSNSQNKSMKASTILDFLYSANSKTKKN